MIIESAGEFLQVFWILCLALVLLGYVLGYQHGKRNAWRKLMGIKRPTRSGR